MSQFNYSKICSDLLKGLSERQKTVLSRRFSISPKDNKGEGETLESIGKSFGVTRERVRQIENDAFSKIRPEIKKYQEIFQYFKQSLKNKGGVSREDLLLEQLAGKEEKNQVSFLLNLNQEFTRFSETPDFYPFWALEKDAFSTIKKTTSSLQSELKKMLFP
jgi:transcriptional regulator with XRE-family HTH domain